MRPLCAIPDDGRRLGGAADEAPVVADAPSTRRRREQRGAEPAAPQAAAQQAAAGTLKQEAAASNREVSDKLIEVFQAKKPADWRKLIAYSRQWPMLAQGVLDRWAGCSPAKLGAAVQACCAAAALPDLCLLDCVVQLQCTSIALVTNSLPRCVLQDRGAGGRGRGGRVAGGAAGAAQAGPPAPDGARGAGDVPAGHRQVQVGAGLEGGLRIEQW